MRVTAADLALDFVVVVLQSGDDGASPSRIASNTASGPRLSSSGVFSIRRAHGGRLWGVPVAAANLPTGNSQVEPVVVKSEVGAPSPTSAGSRGSR